jgi:hypothetical protein
MKEGDTVWTAHKEPEPSLRPRGKWEAWYKRQGNKGSVTHVEWKRRAAEQKAN